MAYIKEVIVPKENRLGQGYLASAADAGTWVKEDGFFSAADITALGSSNSNKPGYAFTGALKLTPVTSGTGSCYPINRNISLTHGSETDYDNFAAGQGVIYYTGGEFETDQYSSVSGTGATAGDYLKLNTSGILVEETSPTVKTRETVAVVTFKYDGGNPTKDALRFRMLNKDAFGISNDY